MNHSISGTGSEERWLSAAFSGRNFALPLKRIPGKKQYGTGIIAVWCTAFQGTPCRGNPGGSPVGEASPVPIKILSQECTLQHAFPLPRPSSRERTVSQLRLAPPCQHTSSNYVILRIDFLMVSVYFCREK